MTSSKGTRGSAKGRAPDPFVAQIIDLLTPLGPVVARRLFSGHGLYLEDTIFAIVFGGTLFLKADDGNRGDFERRGLGQFTYEGRSGTVGLPYWEVPSSMIKNRRTLRLWARKAHEAGLRHKAKAKKGKRVRNEDGPGLRAPRFEPDF